MTWQVTSDRLAWDRGAVVGVRDLDGCNIGALVAGGHLAPVQGKVKSKRMPEAPATDTADEPEEQD